MAPLSHLLRLLLTSLFTLLAASLPTNPNTTNSLIEQLTYPLPASTYYLDIFLSHGTPLPPTPFTDVIAKQLATLDHYLARHPDAPMFRPMRSTSQGCYLTTKAIEREVTQYMMRDFRDVVIALQTVLVRPGLFFETFWYLRDKEGVAFANGIIADKKPPPDWLGGLQLGGVETE